MTAIDEATTGCFAGNADVDDRRHAIRNDAAERVDAKIEALRSTLPNAPPPPAVAPARGGRPQPAASET